MIDLSSSVQSIGSDGSVCTSMATPAVLLLANAMLILSTIQRLQAILTRVHETELRLERMGSRPESEAPDLVREELEMHGRRVRLAHRALFALYAAAAVLLLMIGALGAGAMGWEAGGGVALLAAFGGAALLLGGTALLTAETWVGVGATDRRVRTVKALCDAGRAASPEPAPSRDEITTG